MENGPKAPKILVVITRTKACTLQLILQAFCKQDFKPLITRSIRISIRIKNIYLHENRTREPVRTNIKGTCKRKVEAINIIERRYIRG